MRHFMQLDPVETARLFHRPPTEVDRQGDLLPLSIALGATLYSPATRPTLAADITKYGARGLTSMVIDLEDAIADDAVDRGEANVAQQLRAHHAEGAETPMLFVRVREPGQIGRMVDRLGSAVGVLTGFVVPKFSAANGAAYLGGVAAAGARTGVRLLAMPVLETPEIAHRETRRESLVAVSEVLEEYRAHVLALRLGATDLCAAYGLRRPRDMPIYDVHVVAEVIADVVNTFGRVDGSGFTITGPVWEYFSASASRFGSRHPRALRRPSVVDGLDGLVREMVLDQANGLSGKTVIHPAHVAVVNALSVVGHEDFTDAADILGDAPLGGVRSSRYANKMNEVKPHEQWARRTLTRAAIFGVAAEGVGFVDLFEASVKAVARVDGAEPASTEVVA